jgi:hypothetical protein
MSVDVASYAEPVSDQFEVGHVLSGTFEAIRRQFRMLLLLTALCVFLPVVISGVINFEYNSSPQLNAINFFWDGFRHHTTPPDYLSGGRLAILAVSVFGGLFLQAAVASTVVADFEGAAIPNPLSAWKHVLPLLGIDIVIFLAFSIGSLFLVLPGVLAVLAFSVAGPARVNEGHGVFTTLQRSRELTGGHRWRILLLIVLYVLAEMALGVVFGAVKMILHAPTAIWAVSVAPAIAATLALVRTVGLSVIYCELWVAKDGVAATTLATAFD